MNDYEREQEETRRAVAIARYAASEELDRPLTWWERWRVASRTRLARGYRFYFISG